VARVISVPYEGPNVLLTSPTPPLLPQPRYLSFLSSRLLSSHYACVLNPLLHLLLLLHRRLHRHGGNGKGMSQSELARFMQRMEGGIFSS